MLTIMVVTDPVDISSTNQTFLDSCKDCNVVKLVGNADESRPVADHLTWTPVVTAGVDSRTVIQVVLESIYYGRMFAMKDIYTST